MMVYARQHLLDISIIQSECIWFFCWKLARSVFFSVFYSTIGGLVIGETTFPINVISETQDLNIQRFGFNVCFTKNTLSWKLFELFWKEKIARHEIFTLWRKNISTVEAKQKNTFIIFYTYRLLYQFAIKRPHYWWSLSKLIQTDQVWPLPT